MVITDWADDVFADIASARADFKNLTSKEQLTELLHGNTGISEQDGSGHTISRSVVAPSDSEIIKLLNECYNTPSSAAHPLGWSLRRACEELGIDRDSLDF